MYMHDKPILDMCEQENLSAHNIMYLCINDEPESVGGWKCFVRKCMRRFYIIFIIKYI